MNSPPLLPNFLAGRWQNGSGNGSTLLDPVLGKPLVRVSSAGLDLAEGFSFAREQGGAALRALTYRQRATLDRKSTRLNSSHRYTSYSLFSF